MAWERVANSADIAVGRGHSVIVRGKDLALFIVDGHGYCIDNVCPHMEGPLAEGEVEGEIVYCPWHWWPINVRTGELTFDAGVCTATYPCKIDDGGVFVDLG